MDKQECYVIYQIQIGKNKYKTEETTLMLDIDDSIEDQLRSRFPKIVDWKWQIVGEEKLRD
jgi:hypothetical protein